MQFALVKETQVGGDAIPRFQQNEIAGHDVRGIDVVASIIIISVIVSIYTVLGGLKAAGLTRVNVSLDTLRPERFAALTRREGLAQVLAGLVEIRGGRALARRGDGVDLPSRPRAGAPSRGDAGPD